jgi:toxin-antitoxin system PIN domain toxin
VYLLDVNVLIALADSLHRDHEKVSLWFSKTHLNGWATCPITENGFLRILGHPNYPNGLGSIEKTRDMLLRLRALPGHQFWPEAISLCHKSSYPVLPAAKDLTNFYLLGLAVKNQGHFATLDQRFDPLLIPGGPSVCFLIS